MFDLLKRVAALMKSIKINKCIKYEATVIWSHIFENSIYFDKKRTLYKAAAPVRNQLIDKLYSLFKNLIKKFVDEL